VTPSIHQSTVPAPAAPLIDFRSVAVRLGEVTIFSDLSLSIAAGEFVCLLGPSGCGKSTMLRLIGGLLDPSAGTVMVDGRSPHDAWDSISYVFQSPRLVPWRNARDNAALGIELRNPSVPKADRQARASELLRLMGLGNDMGKYPLMLSGGERQRVAIARALAVDPAIVLMDEPFSALDPETRRRMRRDVVELWRTARKTVVFVTHDVDEAIELADRIVVFSAKPTRILDTLKIDEARPRAIDGVPALRAARAQWRSAESLLGPRPPPRRPS
jgi:NitT/TauT family transport system ATP-binding protein